MQYDITKNPCMTAIMKDGGIQAMSLPDIFVHAHEIKDIKSHSNMPTYYTSLLSFLCYIACDITRPYSKYEKSDMLDKGSFDENQVRQYFSDCIKKGACFDLCDEKRPFLQVPENELKPAPKEKNSNYVSVCKLNPKMVSNTSIVFNSGMDAGEYAKCIHHEYGIDINETGMIPEKALKNIQPQNMFSIHAKDILEYLIAPLLVAGSGGQGYYCAPCCNGSDTALFILIKGRNLFEKIIFNMPILKKGKEGTPIYLWKSMFPVENRNEEADGALSYLLYPHRQVLLDWTDTTSEDPEVRNLYFYASPKRDKNIRDILSAKYQEYSCIHPMTKDKQKDISMFINAGMVTNIVYGKTPVNYAAVPNIDLLSIAHRLADDAELPQNIADYWDIITDLDCTRTQMTLQVVYRKSNNAKIDMEVDTDLELTKVLEEHTDWHPYFADGIRLFHDCEKLLQIEYKNYLMDIYQDLSGRNHITLKNPEQDLEISECLEKYAKKITHLCTAEFLPMFAQIYTDPEKEENFSASCKEIQNLMHYQIVKELLMAVEDAPVTGNCHAAKVKFRNRIINNIHTKGGKNDAE